MSCIFIITKLWFVSFARTFSESVGMSQRCALSDFTHCGKSTHRAGLVSYHAPYRDSLHCDKVRESNVAVASDCGGFRARVTLPKSQQRLSRARELELRRSRHALRSYLYAFCNCPAAHLYLSPQRYCKHNIRLALVSFWSFVC